MRDPKPPPAASSASGLAVADEEDAALVARARQDRRAFGPLYDRYADRVYRSCLRRLGTREAAEDATSLVFAKALADLPLNAAGDPPDAAPDADPAARALAAEATRELRALLAALPPDQRRVVELRLAGLTGAEIAETMGRSLAAVKMLQVRALGRLRAAHAAATTGAGGPR